MRKIQPEWMNHTPSPYEIGSPYSTVYEIMPDGSKERIELEIIYTEGAL